MHRLGVVPELTLVMMTVPGGLSELRFPVVLPVHPVARAIARETARSAAALEELARRHHTGVRHVQRLFVEQTGLVYTRWRTRARLNTAIERLNAGHGLPESLLSEDPLAALDATPVAALTPSGHTSERAISLSIR